MSDVKEVQTTATIVFTRDDVKVTLSGMDFVSPQKLNAAGRKLNRLFLEYRAKFIEASHQAEEAKTKASRLPPPAPPAASGEKSVPVETKTESPQIEELKKAAAEDAKPASKAPPANPFKK